jgi:tetratricopeptide (TPR) repeat protein
VQKFDKDLKDFELPEAVRKASTPPKNERFTDRWNNVKMSQPKSGDFFNRRTCVWYWNSKRKDVTLLQGLIMFAKEDYETAEKHWDKIADIDKDFYAEQEKSGWGNATTHYRLTQRIKYQPGALFATPDEMEVFKDPKRRLAVLLADLYYLAEEPKKAYRMYRLLESGNLGTLSYNEKAYICFAIFSCMCWDKEVNEIAYLEPKLKAFVGTPSEVRVVLGFANRLKIGEKKELVPKKIKAYEYLIQKFPKTEEAELLRSFSV